MAPPNGPVETRFFTRCVIFACNHHTERVYPIRDLRGPSFTAADPPVPMHLALRLADECFPCARTTVLDHYRASAQKAHETMAALRARLDRMLNKADTDTDTDVDEQREGCEERADFLHADSNEDDDDEAWPEQPLTAGALLCHIQTSDGDGDGDGASDATIRPPEPKPTAKLSTNIRLLREELERRVKAWSGRDKAKAVTKAATGPEPESDALPKLSAEEMAEIADYEDFDAETIDYTAL